MASIHDRVVFKQADLDQRLHYDKFARKSLMDHFYDNDATLGCCGPWRGNRTGRFCRTCRSKQNCDVEATGFKFKCVAMETRGASRSR